MNYPRISLKAARVNANLTQREAAEKLKISRSTLKNYEDGRTSPTMETVREMESLYNFPQDYIFFGNKYA